MKRSSYRVSEPKAARPGQNKGDHSALLQRLLNDIAPGLPDACPELLAPARRYVLLEEEAPPEEEENLKTSLKYFLALGEKKGVQADEEAVFSLLEGMRIILHDQKLSGLEGLEAFTLAHKEMFGNFLRGFSEPSENERHTLP